MPNRITTPQKGATNMKALDYGELAEWYLKKKLLAYVEFGSYQGEYIVVIDDGDDVLLYKGYYGSCSGCDWLEAERDWVTDEIKDDVAKEFCQQEFSHPFAAIPKETIKRVDANTFISFLPANVRAEMYEFDGEELYSEIKKTI